MWPLSAEGGAASPLPRKLRHAADSTWSCWRKSCGLISNCQSSRAPLTVARETNEEIEASTSQRRIAQVPRFTFGPLGQIVGYLDKSRWMLSEGYAQLRPLERRSTRILAAIRRS